MGTYYYEKDANGKQVLVGTYTPDRDANGVALSTGTYKPVGSGGTVGSGSSSGKTGSSASTGTKTGTTATGSTGNSQYSGVTGNDSAYQNWLATDKNAATAKAAGANPEQLQRLYEAGVGWVTEYNKGNMAAADAYHAAAEAVRAELQYSGGKDGSEYNPFPKTPGDNNSGFDYGPAPTHNDSYSSTIDKMLNDILNRDKFSYNALEDPLYQQYSQQYQREGQRAMQDTLGQVSARTGGMASSYAVSAAQQANNYYASQMADKIPELYQLAYQMYLDDIDLQVQDLGLLENASDRQYNRYRDTMDDWRKDRDFAYDQFRDDIDDERYKGEWIHQLGREQVTDSQWQQTHDRNIFESDRDYESGEDTDAYKRVWDMLTAGVMPDDAMLEAAGISKDQASGILAESQNGDAYNKVWDLLDKGVMPDDEMLQKAGISAVQAAAIIATQKAKQTSSSGSSYKPNLSASAVVDALESGIVNDEMRRAYKYYYGQDWVPDEEKPKPEPGPTPPTAPTPTSTETADSNVGNTNGESWVYVPGFGRLSWDELESYVDKGKIKETMRDGKYWYTKVN